MRYMIVCAAVAAISSAAVAETVVNLDELQFDTGDYSSAAFSSQGAGFNYFDSGFSWAGWAYSRVNDTTTAGFTNQYSAITGTGFGGSGNYAVGYMDQFNVVNPTIDLPEATSVSGLYVTNATYPYLVMKNGDTAFGVQAFDATDWYKLTITAKDSLGQALGSTEVDLASGTAISSSWQWVDLSGHGNSVKSLTFTVDSSDKFQTWLNTPSYFALDNLTVAAVPEPTALGLIGVAGVLAMRRKRS